MQLIQDFGTKDAGIVHRASLAGRDPSVMAAKKYQQMVKDRALTFQQKPMTYGLLANERQRINAELTDYYKLTPDGKDQFLKAHPLFEVDKAIAKYIRDITYPEMDRLSGQLPGTTEELQGKYGALKSIKGQLLDQMEKVYTESRQGATKGINVSSYATPSGIGWSLHRLPMKLGANDVESQATRKVASAFGNSVGSKIRKMVTSPKGNDVLGDSILSSPVRILIGVKDTPPTPKPPVEQDNDTPEPQTSATPPSSPRELLDKAKRLNPSAQGQVAYSHVAVNPINGHRIGSSDGITWRDIQTGQQVA